MPLVKFDVILIVSVVENGAADWSFGSGEAQFMTGGL